MDSRVYILEKSECLVLLEELCKKTETRSELHDGAEPALTVYLDSECLRSTITTLDHNA